MSQIAPDISELAAQILAAATILGRYDISHWELWLRRDAERILKRDFAGVEHFLSAFGGMSSLNDVLICRANGHSIAKDSEASVNAELSSLLNCAYLLANALRREHESGA